jgi:hypothetical protein
MNRVTASGSARVLQCSGHVRLPWVIESSPAADNGNRCHKLMETNDHDRDPQTAAAHAAWTEWLDANGYRVPACQKEYAMALCMETRRARPIGGNGHRDYSAARPSELCGTADMSGYLVTADGKRVSFVLDWKFGAERVEADSAQMRTLAAMHGSLGEQVDEQVMTIVVQSPPDGRAEARAVLLAMDDLGAHVDMLADAWNEAREANVLQRGAECKYCPAVASCPAQLAALSALVAPSGPGPITPDRAGAIWLELRQAKKRLEAIEEACKAMAAELPEGLPLPGGKRLVATTRSRTTIDAKALEAVARQHGATSDEIAACARTTTYSTTQEIK